MRKIVALLILCSLLLACSPSKRIARLIDNHPELLRPQIIRLRDTITTNYFRKDSLLILNPRPAHSDIANHDTGITIEVPGARATFTPNPDGTGLLSVENLPEVIPVELDTIIPTIHIQTVEKKVSLFKQIEIILLLIALSLFFAILLGVAFKR